MFLKKIVSFSRHLHSSVMAGGRDELKEKLQNLNRVLAELAEEVNKTAQETVEEVSANTRQKTTEISNALNKLMVDIRNSSVDEGRKEELQRMAEEIKQKLQTKKEIASEAVSKQLNALCAGILETLANAAKEGSESLKKAAEASSKKADEFKEDK